MKDFVCNCAQFFVLFIDDDFAHDGTSLDSTN
jgi:hypothetical protein